MPRLSSVLTILVVAVLVGCQVPDAPAAAGSSPLPPTETPSATVELTAEPTAFPVPEEFDPAPIAAGYPLVDGSTSAEPLQRLVACIILGVQCIWDDFGFAGRGRMIVPDAELEGSHCFLMWPINGSFTDNIKGEPKTKSATLCASGILIRGTTGSVWPIATSLALIIWKSLTSKAQTGWSVRTSPSRTHP